MKLNLKKIFIVLTVIITSAFLLYFVIFTLCFNNASLLNKTKNIITILTQKKVRISKVSCSPFGNFKISNFNLSNMGGFDNGVLLSIDNLFVRISMFKLLRAHFIANDFYINGFRLNLNFENKKKFNCFEFYKNIKTNFNQHYARYSFIKKMEIKYIFIENGIINLKLDLGHIKIYNIVLDSNVFNYESNYFKGSMFFNFKLGNVQTETSCDFDYDKATKTLRVTGFKCEDLSLYAEGVVRFLENGDTTIEYSAKINRSKYKNLVYTLTGINPINGNSINDIEDVVIYYPNIKAKEIRTSI
ncbi:MAG: hypothetical protein LBU10_00470 [Endomicrobium sp.]|jgi:hypothetical protein|nr:hypothetical protein [Endomicrobium sp.]